MNAEVLSRTERALVLSALGDPVRLGVVELLQVQDLSPDALASALEVPGNLLAHHLRILENAEVITRTQSQSDRRRTYVHLEPGSLNGLIPPSELEASRVVFVCTHNSARSVLAEAMWRTVSDVPSASAGTHPAARVNPRARAAATRMGLDLSLESPRRIADVLESDDLIISVCDSVNEDLGAMENRRLHWSIPDPSATDTDEAFDVALADIGQRIATITPHVHARPSTNPRRRR